MSYRRTKKYRTLKSNASDDASDEQKKYEIPVVVSSDELLMNISDDSNRMESSEIGNDRAFNVLTVDDKSIERELSADVSEK